MWLVADLMPEKSLPQIGWAFHRDHTTILHGKRRAREIIARSLKHIAKVNQIIAELQKRSGLS